MHVTNPATVILTAPPIAVVYRIAAIKEEKKALKKIQSNAICCQVCVGCFMSSAAGD